MTSWEVQDSFTEYFLTFFSSVICLLISQKWKGREVEGEILHGKTLDTHCITSITDPTPSLQLHSGPIVSCGVAVATHSRIGICSESERHRSLWPTQRWWHSDQRARPRVQRRREERAGRGKWASQGQMEVEACPERRLSIGQQSSTSAYHTYPHTQHKHVWRLSQPGRSRCSACWPFLHHR